jgi:hypothetical protein
VIGEIMLSQLGVLDLSIVTDLLIQTLTNSWNTSPLWGSLPDESFFTPSISGLTPEAVRTTGGCQVTVSLIHIEPNKFNRNFVSPPPPQPPVGHLPPARAQLIPYLPLSLDLYYFITASSDNNYHQEQQAMSVVLRCFHQNPIIRTNVIIPGSPPESTQEEFTVTMEIETADSISRLWQAITAPFRLSLLYRVAVAFLTPPDAAGPAPPVRRYGLAVEPASFPVATAGQAFGTTSTARFAPPSGNPPTVSVDYSPATVGPGERFTLLGAGLNQGTDVPVVPNPGTSFRVFLLLPADYQTEVEVTAWKTKDVLPASPIQTASRIVLDLPPTVGALPVNAPPPGVYAIRAGSQSPPDLISNRTNSTPFNIAARVDVPASPAGPIVPEVAGAYTITGMGFIAGTSTQVLLETVPLTYVAAPPLQPGQFTVGSISHISFQRPNGLPPGLYGIRVRVNGVESPPALWIKV